MSGTATLMIVDAMIDATVPIITVASTNQRYEGPKRSARASREWIGSGVGTGGGGVEVSRRLSSPAVAGPAPLPDRDALLGRQVHRVAGLDAEGRIERRVVAHRAVDAEFVGRMRIRLDLRQQDGVARLAAERL